MKFNAATLGAVLWPAFLGAAAADGLLFTLIDPLALDWLGSTVEVSRPAAYTIGFFVFWFIIICTNFMTLWLHDDQANASKAERNRRNSER